MVEFMTNFNQRAMVWAADDVLVAWIEWRHQLIDSGHEGKPDEEHVFV
jgi:hypothetical protein